MTEPPGGVPMDESTAVYEIRLKGGSAARLRRQFPTAKVATTRTETMLRREVEAPAELDDLIEQLLSLGLVLTEVREVAQRSPWRSQPKEGRRDDQIVRDPRRG